MDKHVQAIIDRAKAVCASWEQVKAAEGFDERERALGWLDAGLDRLTQTIDGYDAGKEDHERHHAG